MIDNNGSLIKGIRGLLFLMLLVLTMTVQAQSDVDFIGSSIVL